MRGDMKTKKITIFAFLVVLSAGVAIYGQKPGKDKGSVDVNDKMSAEMVYFFGPDRVAHGFMLANPKYFNRRDLTAFFRQLSKEYSRFTLVTIGIYSDRENLEIAIRNLKQPPPDANPPYDTSESDCKDLKNAIRPCPTGYYRASYFRFDEREFFDYSKYPDKSTMTRVLLKRNGVKEKTWKK